ncbi:MAG: hypothetical protein AAF243_07900 [Cyanobacteria bacterium P01_A01_bin.137]
MTWWIRSILIGLMIVLGSVGMDRSVAMAVPTDQPPVVQSRDDDGSHGFQIVPELTSPAEMPVVEVQPKTVAPFPWLGNGATDDQSSEDAGDSVNSVDATLEQWLSSVTTFFEGN